MTRLTTEQTQGSWLRRLRRYPRVRLDAPVALAYDGRALLVQAADVCEGGLGIVLGESLPDGAAVSVSFALPTSHELVNLECVVVHPDQGVTGLAFTSTPAAARRLLRRYINMRRFLHGDLRSLTDNPEVARRLSERLGKVRKLTVL